MHMITYCGRYMDWSIILLLIISLLGNISYHCPFRRSSVKIQRKLVSMCFNVTEVDCNHYGSSWYHVSNNLKFKTMYVSLGGLVHWKNIAWWLLLVNVYHWVSLLDERSVSRVFYTHCYVTVSIRVCQMEQ